MSKLTYGPDDPWPRHQSDYWRTALNQARAAGWTLKYLNAPHYFGQVVCPGSTEDQCSFSVDSTARGSETKALEVPKRLKRCRHGTPPPDGSRVAERQATAQRLLGRAEGLIDQAAEGLSRAEDKQAAIAQFELLLDTAEVTLDEVLASAQDAALERAVELEDAPEPWEVESQLDEASHVLQEASNLADRIKRPGLARPLLVRAAAARERLEGLRERLASV